MHFCCSSASRFSFSGFKPEFASIFSAELGSAPDPTKMTDRSVSVGSVTSPTDPTLGLRIESGRSDFLSEFWSVGGRIKVGRSVGSTLFYLRIL